MTTGVWILIMALNGALTTQEFSTESACNKAALAFEGRFKSRFDTLRVHTAKALCVPKEV
jgi:hypothetical protein